MASVRSDDVDERWANLITRAQAGDEQAFAQIWRRHQPSLLRYLEIVSGRHAAEDVAADTWVSMVRALPRFRGDEVGFKALLFTTARSRLVDASRRAKARPQVASDLASISALDGLDTIDLRHAGIGDEIDAGIERDESTRAALSLIACLPPGQAEVVALRVIAGLDNDDVARITGKRSGAVRVAYSRGIAGLAGMIDLPSGVTDPDEPAFR
jgi:RNA polymerase sigma-70 factor (ECF subfamily)